MMESVKLIIERLKTHPEDFFGDVNEPKSLGIRQPKFYRMVERLDNLLTDNQDGQVHRLWFLEPEEKEALIAAYKEARRVRFEAQTFHTLLTKQDDGIAVQVRSHPQTGKILMQGAQVPLWQSAVPKGEGEPI